MRPPRPSVAGAVPVLRRSSSINVTRPEGAAATAKPPMPGRPSSGGAAPMAVDGARASQASLAGSTLATLRAKCAPDPIVDSRPYGCRMGMHRDDMTSERMMRIGTFQTGLPASSPRDANDFGCTVRRVDKVRRESRLATQDDDPFEAGNSRTLVTAVGARGPRPASELVRVWTTGRRRTYERSTSDASLRETEWSGWGMGDLQRGRSTVTTAPS